VSRRRPAGRALLSIGQSQSWITEFFAYGIKIIISDWITYSCWCLTQPDEARPGLLLSTPSLNLEIKVQSIIGSKIQKNRQPLVPVKIGTDSNITPESHDLGGHVDMFDRLSRGIWLRGEVS
jgi:hypothetical protein